MKILKFRAYKNGKEYKCMVGNNDVEPIHFFLLSILMKKEMNGFNQIVAK